MTDLPNIISEIVTAAGPALLGVAAASFTIAVTSLIKSHRKNRAELSVCRPGALYLRKAEVRLIEKHFQQMNMLMERQLVDLTSFGHEIERLRGESVQKEIARVQTSVIPQPIKRDFAKLHREIRAVEQIFNQSDASRGRMLSKV